MNQSSGGPPIVVLAGSSAPLFDRVEVGLADFDCEIVRFRDEADFIAAPAALDRASVFYGYGSLPIGADRLARAPRLRAIISAYTGTEGFDETAATARGVLVGNGQIDENFTSMAEASILLILAALFDLNGKQQAFRAADSAPSPRPTAHMLGGKTVGLLGFGRIARAVSDRLAGWGVRLIATTPRPAPWPGVSFVPLDELLADSDVLCVLAPLNASTAGLLDAARLRQTKPGSVLVVVSRGGIVDEQAVFELARDGHFLRVAMDVFAEEPCPADSPLRTLGSAILTPHSIGHSRELLTRLPEAGVQSILAVLAGRPPDRLRNPEIVPQWRSRWGRPAGSR